MPNLKYLLLLTILCSLVLFTNCGEDSDDPVAEDTIDPIIGSWVLTNEEWTGSEENPNSLRACFLKSDHGKPNKWNITTTKATQKMSKHCTTLCKNHVGHSCFSESLGMWNVALVA